MPKREEGTRLARATLAVLRPFAGPSALAQLRRDCPVTRYVEARMSIDIIELYNVGLQTTDAATF